MAKRISLSKKIRFEVFKRDFFKCQYCGTHPPETVLEVDHIHPHSKGGNDDINNLITSCFNCNRGKSDRELNQIPNSLVNNIEIAKEKLKQYKEFQKLNNQLFLSIKLDIDLVDATFTSYFKGYRCSEKFRNATVKMFIEKLSLFEVVDSMHIAGRKNLDSDETLKYFCGVCYNKIKNL